MTFQLSKCGMLVLMKGTIVNLNGIVLPNGKLMKEIDNHGNQYLGIVELDKIKQRNMKDKLTIKYRSLKLVLK